MGKGSNKRPPDIPKEVFEANWRKIFTKREKKPDEKREIIGNGS